MRGTEAGAFVAGLMFGLSGHALAHQAVQKPAQEPSITCALDSESYKRDARALAVKMPGGKLEDPDGYAVSFDSPVYGRVSLRIGGCAHLGLEVSAKARARTAASRAAAMKIARGLTSDHLVPAWHTDLLEVLSRAPSEATRNGGQTILLFKQDRYVEFAVTYGFENGFQTVEVSVIPDT